MKNHTVIKRYARALLAIGKEDGNFAAYGRELKELADTLAAAGEMAKALTSPAYPDGLRRKSLTEILNKAALSPKVNNFVQLLADKGRLAELQDVAEAYNLLADEERGIIHGSLVSAKALSPDEVEAIRSSLNKFSGHQVELTIEEDPSIIGGLIARLGDLSIDGSVRTQLAKLSEQLDAL